MYRNKTFNRKKVMIVFVAVFFIMMFLIGRLVYLMIFCSEYYGNKAENLHERERDIKAARGKLLDANGTVLATNKSVCTISVIHNQMEEPEKVIAMLVKELGISEEAARKRVEKVSSIERVKTNVAKETGDAIRAYGLSGVKVDEDYKRYYPYGTLASKVLGFTGAMQDSVRDAFGITLKYLGYSLNSTDLDELTEAKNKLIEQKPLVQAYVVDQARDKMIGNEAALGVIYSGEALYCQQENPNLDYVIPKEGSNLWIDSWVIPKNAENKEHAEEFINFLCRPDIAKMNFEYITYSIPNSAGQALIEDDYMRNSTIAFPNIDQLKNCEIFNFLGDENEALYNELWREVKSK